MSIKLIFVFLFIYLWNFTAESKSRKDILHDLKTIRSKTAASTQKYAALDVINRLLPDHSHLFNVEIYKSLGNENESFTRAYEIIKNKNDAKVLIKATDGVTACKGFHYYLKYYLNGHVSWSGAQLNNIPNEMPNIHYKQYSPSAFLYHQNVCTWGYSFVWWTWADWRKHIDWMALMGITLTIAPIQEAIWTKVYQDFGLTQEEIDDHLSGPAFLPWQRMGNMRGWSGSLPSNYKYQQMSLQKQILTAQRDLGMTIALPAFAGHLPVAFKRIYPNISFTRTTCWNDFSTEYCCPLFIDPDEKLFQEIGGKFLKEIIHEYGTDNLYFSDPFNEVEPKKLEPEYMAKVSASIYSAMTSVDPKAVWLLQGWFLAQNVLWSEDIIKSFLTAVPQGNLLILDLQSELAPQYERTKSYYGQPFIWCMLHNFGGTLGMHGSIHIVNTRITLAQEMENSTMIGVGITPEGIFQNYALYEFALERGWAVGEFDTNRWFKTYSLARYGTSDENIDNAWDIIQNTVYDYRNLIKLHGKYTIARRPNLKLDPWIWYDPNKFMQALGYFTNANKKVLDSKLFQYDLIDVTRQFLQLAGDSIYLELIKNYKSKNLPNLHKLRNKFRELFDDLEDILSTNENFLLGKWLEAAKSMALTPLEEEVYEINARNQITLWGPNGEINDYATKQWSGIVSDYFKPRWELFMNSLMSAVANQTNFNQNKFKKNVFNDVENPFSVDRKMYRTTSNNNTVELSKKIYKKWLKYIEDNEINLNNIPIRENIIEYNIQRSLLIKLRTTPKAILAKLRQA